MPLRPSPGAERAPASISETSSLLQHAHSPATNGTTSVAPEDSSVAVGPYDEETLGPSPPEQEGQPKLSNAAIIRILCILLIAVFLGYADGSLVMATHPIIASDFQALESSSWLFTAFGLAAATTQSTAVDEAERHLREKANNFDMLHGFRSWLCYCVGRDFYLLQTARRTRSDAFYASGLGNSMAVVILGRVISGGVSGAMAVLVSILISDLVPLREIATWRSYTNLVGTTGRSLGGPVGGWLADVVGWRWSFLGQVPLFLIALVLCSLFLPSNIGAVAKPAGDGNSAKASSKLARIDFLGAAALSSFVLSFLLPMEIGGVQVPWSHPILPVLLGLAVLFLVLFVYVERRVAKEPIIPMSLFAQKNVVVSIAIMSLQAAAQIGMMFCVPLYFQVTQRASLTEAGAHLFPAVAGNAVGGIISGHIIKRTGKYKWLIYLATFSACVSYSLMLLRWHGDTNWWESLYITPGGFGTGVAQSAVFIALQAAVEKSHVSPSISTLYLAQNFSVIIGTASVSATLQEFLHRSLITNLSGLGLDPAEKAAIIAKAASDVGYVYKAKGEIGKAIVASYVDGLWYTHGLSLLLSSTAFLITFLLDEKPL